MRILILIPNLDNIGGVGNFYKVLNLTDIKGIDYFEIGRSPNESIFKTFLRLPLDYLRFVYLIIKNRYQIIHVNPSLDPKSFYRDSLFVCLSHLLRRETVVFFRGWDSIFYEKIKRKRILRFIMNHSFLKATKIITLGNIFKDFLLYFDSSIHDKIQISSTVADNRYIDKFIISDKNNSFRKNVNFLFLSRLVDSKGLYEAVEIFNSVREKFNNVTFNIIGDGDEKSNFLNYVNRNGIEGINYHGKIDGESKYEIMSQSHILLFLSKHGEGLPNVILEGLLYGLTIISSDKGSINEWINSTNGYIYSDYDKNHMLKYIYEIMNNPNQYYDMAKRNHEYAKSNFTTDIVRSKMLNHYKDIIGD